MQPINYILPGSNPMEEALKGYQTGLSFQSQRQTADMNASREARAQELHPLAVEGAEQNIAIRGAQEARTQEEFAVKQARQQAFQSAMGGLVQKGRDATFEDYMAVTTEFPQLSKGLMETWDALDDDRKKGQIQLLAQAAAALKNGETNRAILLGRQYADAAEEAGDTVGAETGRSMIMVAEANPDAALASLGAALTTLDEGVAKRVLGTSDEKVNVREVQDFQDGTSITYFSDGTRKVRSASGETVEGQAAADLIAQANEAGTALQRDRAAGRTAGSNEANVESGGQAKAAQALGTLQGKFVDGAFKAADGAASNIRNIQTAIDAIDSGARAGLFDKNIPAIDAATAELRNAMDKMGLDVIGSVTFGALSAAELNLAMETAVPRNLDSPDLKVWLEKKLDAQKKMRVALMEQAQFLSDPQNTLKDWANRVRGDTPEEDDGDYMKFLEGK